MSTGKYIKKNSPRRPKHVRDKSPKKIHILKNKVNPKDTVRQERELI